MIGQSYVVLPRTDLFMAGFPILADFQILLPLVYKDSSRIPALRALSLRTQSKSLRRLCAV